MKKKTILVLFGATGDLAKRKLFPALSDINKKQLENFEIIAVGRAEKNSEELKSELKKNEFIKDFNFLKNLEYFKIDFNNINSYIKLKKIIDKKSENFETQVIFYLAMPPELFNKVLENIKKSKLNEEKISNKKIVFEKPFGNNLESSTKLNENLMKVFKEEQVYRIDHFLGKEAVQNFLVLRFANHFLEPLWNNRHIDNIQITASETLGIENRAGYYEKSGALRDMVQNHLFQMLSLIAMEAPVNLDAESIRDEKVKVFSAIKNLKEDNLSENVVFGQYSKGKINGKNVISYKEENGVDKNSRTETYTALKIEIDNWRWSGVPFYLRTGKRLKEKGTFVVIEFKKVPNILFNKEGNLEKNRLIIKIQPDENIKLSFNIKKTNSNEITNIETDFDHKEFFKTESPEAYEKLIYDIIKSDRTLFTRWDGVEKSWKIVDKLVNCKDKCPIIFSYESGTMGPKEADKLLEKDGKNWFNF